MKNEAMITEKELAGTARAMLATYGPDAVDVARSRSMDLKRMGDPDGFLKWRLITDAIRCAGPALAKMAG